MPNRKLSKTVNGVTYEVPVFPMDWLNISQGVNGYFSHKGAPALDCCGKDTGKDPVFAPVRLKYKAHDSAANGNAIFFESVNPVLCADGTVNYLTFMFIHDDNISDVLTLAAKGHIFEQGEEFLDEGVAGYATGNHSHIEVAKGKFVCMYAKNAQGTYQLPNSVSPDKIFVVDGIQLVNNGQPPAGLGDRMNWISSAKIPGVSAAQAAQAKTTKWNADGIIYKGSTVSSGSLEITAIDKVKNLFKIPDLSDDWLPGADFTEADDTGDGKVDNIINSLKGKLYLNPVKIVDVNAAKNEVKTEKGYWLKADKLCVEE